MAGYLRKGLKLIGPYPYNPYLIFLFFSSIFLSRFAPFISLVPGGTERWRAAALVILASSIQGLLLAGGATLVKRYRFWSEESTFLYILEVALLMFLNSLALRQMMHFLTNQIGDFGRDLLPANFNVLIITLTLGLITLALMHQAERRIVERLNTVTGLVVRLEEERERLIHSDENLRRQTSQFLHDRVQSDLMVVGMKLKSISGKSSTEVNEVIDKAIIRLETTRASDLKNLIQVLTPNLEAGTLQAALDVLLDQYRNNMEVSVKIDAATEALDSEVLLGIFRIVEQSILNALVHGPAKRVQISVSTDSMDVTDIIVSDDGPGALVEQITSGLGTSIIDSWVGILNGSKEIDSAPGHGYQLHVTFIAH
jgi:signal transduction histidine kinase